MFEKIVDKMYEYFNRAFDILESAVVTTYKEILSVEFQIQQCNFTSV